MNKTEFFAAGRSCTVVDSYNYDDEVVYDVEVVDYENGNWSTTVSCSSKEDFYEAAEEQIERDLREYVDDPFKRREDSYSDEEWY